MLRLVEPLLAAQIAKGHDIGQAEGEPKEILIAYVCNCVPSIFQGNAATIPVVSRLGCSELQLPCLGINSEAGRRTKATPRQTPIAESNAKLLELAGNLG